MNCVGNCVECKEMKCGYKVEYLLAMWEVKGDLCEDGSLRS
jgi:hypothetical protein